MRVSSRAIEASHHLGLRRVSWRAWLLLALAVVLAAPAMLAARDLYSRGEGTRQPATIYQSGSLAASTPEERVALADLIVLGVVGEPYASRWNTPDGQFPKGVASVQDLPAGQYTIFTDYPVRVERVLYGQESAATVRVRVSGGQVGGDRMLSAEGPDLRAGERVVLLLAQDENPMTRDVGPGHYIVLWGALGKYQVEGGEAVSPDHRLPLSEMAEFIREAKR